MTTAKIFKNGSSQAVRLPKECRFSASEVYAQKLGDIVILLPKRHPWQSLVKSLDHFSDDFMDAREQPALSQVRDEL
jgi:antitoxin VapB